MHVKFLLHERRVAMGLREYGVMLWLTPNGSSDVSDVLEAFNELDAIYRLMHKHGISDVLTAVGWLYPAANRDAWVRDLHIPTFD
jgi:hypothetical protein